MFWFIFLQYYLPLFFNQQICFRDSKSFYCFSAAIFLGSFRMPYHEIRRMIVEVDEDQLTEPMIQVQQDLHKAVKNKGLVHNCLTLLHQPSYIDHGIVSEMKK